jgi:hypothetical protein
MKKQGNVAPDKVATLPCPICATSPHHWIAKKDDKNESFLIPATCF